MLIAEVSNPEATFIIAVAAALLTWVATSLYWLFASDKKEAELRKKIEEERTRDITYPDGQRSRIWLANFEAALPPYYISVVEEIIRTSFDPRAEFKVIDWYLTSHNHDEAVLAAQLRCHLITEIDLPDGQGKASEMEKRAYDIVFSNPIESSWEYES